MHIDVAADVLATEGELAAIDEAFCRIGFEVRAEAVVERRSDGALPWVIYVTIGAPIATSFTTIAAEAAKDAYPHLKGWVKDVWAARVGAGNGTGSVVLGDADHTTVVLHSAIPEEALDALTDVDWGAARGDYLVWSETRHEWLDPAKAPQGF